MDEESPTTGRVATKGGRSRESKGSAGGGAVAERGRGERRDTPVQAPKDHNAGDHDLADPAICDVGAPRATSQDQITTLYSRALALTQVNNYKKNTADRLRKEFYRAQQNTPSHNLSKRRSPALAALRCSGALTIVRSGRPAA